MRTHGAPGRPARASAPRSAPRPAPPAACLCSVLQEQKSELRKRLSYTTHRLQKLESEFGSTRSYLEVELRRAQEELEKVTLKLRRSGYGTGRGRVGSGRARAGLQVCGAARGALPPGGFGRRGSPGSSEGKLLFPTSSLSQELLNQDLNPCLATARDGLRPSSHPCSIPPSLECDSGTTGKLTAERMQTLLLAVCFGFVF